jgi:dienelactone hydrolase
VFKKLAPLALLLAFAGCGGGGGPKQNARPSLFRYDASAPLRFKDKGRVNRNYPIHVRDVSYAAPGGRVTAFLVVPPGKGPFPAVIYLAGTGEGRSALAVPATWLAARGAVALTVDSAFVHTKGPGPAGPLAHLREERDLTVQTIVDLRRGVDLLRSLSQVDPKQIGFVGFSEGAKLGAILAGVEHRIRAYDLMSAGSPTVESFAAGAPAGLQGPVARVLHQIDPVRYVRRAAPSALFFQDGSRDEYVPKAQLERVARAGSRPKLVHWYAAGHSLNKAAFRDQLAWLSRELGIHGPAVPGAQTGP